VKVVRDSSRGGSSDDNSSSNSMVVVLMVGRGHDRDRGVGEYRRVPNANFQGLFPSYS
jgi:hypothetical protein